MLQKMKALKDIMPEWTGKKVLDIGCDFGFWSFLAAQNGADVLGLDRSRPVKNLGVIDIPKLNHETAVENNLNASFIGYEAGHQWFDFGEADITLLMSLYHHIFQNTGGDHECIWYWLRRHTSEALIWENPVKSEDSVVQLNVYSIIHSLYNEASIREHANRYFDIVYEGPALHETTRVVWKLVPKVWTTINQTGVVKSGAGGASKAFTYENNRRIEEIQYILGVSPIPGSVNVFLEEDFEWNRGYYRTAILDVVDRSQGLDSKWAYKPCRFYPVDANGTKAWAMRFEGERYPKNMVEIISDKVIEKSDLISIKRYL
jgi:CTP-dependent riboflavin kinase